MNGPGAAACGTLALLECEREPDPSVPHTAASPRRPIGMATHPERLTMEDLGMPHSLLKPLPRAMPPTARRPGRGNNGASQPVNRTLTKTVEMGSLRGRASDLQARSGP